MKLLKGTLVLMTLFSLIGCETGLKNKGTTNTTTKNSVESGIVSKGSAVNYKPHVPSNSEIKKIYSKSGTPGYYIQVGYFKNHEPNDEFINRINYAQLPYEIIKKYKNGQPHYYTLVGPYRSYAEAMEIIGSAKEFVTPSAFIVKLTRP
ncbi:MAG: SPOR domain-containing protein [Epsilonproteobacteria bacterium]|nr:SPOR domain-containing protein [Campylobacterota bacterium]